MARFVDQEEADVLKKDNFKSFPSELGEVLIRRIPENKKETITLGLSRFFHTITVDGIYSE